MMALILTPLPWLRTMMREMAREPGPISAEYSSWRNWRHLALNGLPTQSELLRLLFHPTHPFGQVVNLVFSVMCSAF
jgi:hypothetical protein